MSDEHGFKRLNPYPPLVNPGEKMLHGNNFHVVA
jgi:hypothetical protein